MDNFFYTVQDDFLISDLGFCASSPRTMDMTVLELWENKELLKRMNFSIGEKCDFRDFCRFLSRLGLEHSEKDRYNKLISNPTIRVLDTTKYGKILKQILRKRKLEFLNEKT